MSGLSHADRDRTYGHAQALFRYILLATFVLKCNLLAQDRFCNYKVLARDGDLVRTNAEALLRHSLLATLVHVRNFPAQDKFCNARDGKLLCTNAG